MDALVLGGLDALVLGSWLMSPMDTDAYGQHQVMSDIACTCV